MNVIIIENSAILKERYTRLLSSIISIEMLTLGSYSKKSIKFIQNINPDVIIIAQNLDTNIKFKLIKEFNSNIKIINLYSKPFNQKHEKYKNCGADCNLDKSTEFNKLFGIFQELNT